MCGIAVIAGTDAPETREAVDRMVDSLHHRGPDGRGVRRVNGCALGHSRLSVLDLEGGAQPMADPSGRYWITFNGEIYNHADLAHDLRRRGHAIRTRSDTEVLLTGYVEWGAGVLPRLVGQFAFAVWDSRERTLFAARDRLGEKPLYWCHADDGTLVIASELKAILASRRVTPRPDRASMDAYLGLLYVPPGRSIYAGIASLSPGHALRWDQGRLRVEAYWTPRFSATPAPEPREAADRVRTLLTQAVRSQMTADVPIGAFLSGGLDSSTVVALMARETSHPIRTFSVGFGDLDDELPYAGYVSEAYKTQAHEIRADVALGPLLERMADVFDEPFADSSNIPAYLMAEHARRHVKVVLGGDGGDELFGGYDWYRPLLQEPPESPSRTRVWALKVRALVWRALARAGIPAGGCRDRAVLRWVAAHVRRIEPDSWRRHLRYATGFGRDRSPLWNGPAPADGLLEEYRPPDELGPLDRAVHFDLRCYLAGDILVKVDRSSMAHGLEVRAPFLDRDLVEYVLGLPPEFRFGSGESKPLLRQACSELWPEPVRRRRKQGFGAPVNRWMSRPDIAPLVDRVRDPRGPLVRLLPGVSTSWSRLSAQERWTLLCLGLWLERRPTWLDGL